MTDPITTPTDEYLLAQADRLDEWRDHCGYCGRHAVERNSRGQWICAICLQENNPGHWAAVHYEVSIALRAIVAERRALDVGETQDHLPQKDLRMPEKPQAPRSALVEDAITEAFGPRCTEYMPGCLSCDTWAEYDVLRVGNSPDPDIKPVTMLDAAETVNRYAREDVLRPAAGWSEEYADAWGVGVMDCALAISAAIRAMRGTPGA